MTNEESHESDRPTREEVAKFQMLAPLIDSVYQEMSLLSKKSPDGLVNEAKVRLITQRLVEFKQLLRREPVAAYLDALDADNLPTNSDVVLILGQYRKAGDQYRGRHYSSRAYRWLTAEDEAEEEDEYEEHEE